MKPTLYTVVPVLNEAPNLPKLILSFERINKEFQKKFALKFIIVDDGSSDGTANLARAKAGDLDLEVFTHPKNLGPGAAFATAFRSLASRMEIDDFVVTMEGDNTSRVELLSKMLYRVEEGFDVIFASPYLYGGSIRNTSSFRIFLSTIANLFVKELLGIHGLQTVSSFFRLYRADYLKKMQSIYGKGIIEQHGFECMTEMAMKMVFLSARISEIAMVLDTSARVGKSRMKIGQTILGYFSLLSLRKKWIRSIK